MAALQLLSDSPSDIRSETVEVPVIPAEVFDGLEEVRSLLAQAGIAPEETGDDTP
jgi:hypothetical protein